MKHHRNRLARLPAFRPRSLLLLAAALLPLAAGARAQEVVVVAQGSSMRYLANVATDPGIGESWTAPGFADGAWTTGVYGIGYDTGTLPGMLATTTPAGSRSVYTRAHFNVPDPAQVQSITIGADYDDGFAAWLNGVPIARVNVPGGALAWNTNATSLHDSSEGDTASYESITDVTGAALPALRQGDNVLAVGIWNVSAGSSDLALVPLLSFNRPPPVSGTPVCGTLTGNPRWTLAESPYTVTCDVVIPKGSTLTVEAGVQVLFAAGTDLDVAGQLYILGEEDRRVVLTRNQSGTWGGITIDHANDGDSRESIIRFADISLASTLIDINDTGNSPVVVEDCRLDRWTSLAIHWDTSHGLRIRRCAIGVDTPLAEAAHEAINGYRSGALIEYCTFGRRRDYNDVIDLGDTSWGGPVPTLQYNTFLGGDDDAIDFDGSAGWIIGNLVMDHWPRPQAAGNANGGGITGNDASDPVVINNIVYRCYHGIGYKNGTTPLIMNNLVLDCNIGVTFYKDDCDAAPPRPLLYNNVIWGNRDEVSGQPTNVVLHGRWFPDYCQDAGDQAIADIRYSIVEGGWPGVGNLDADPGVADPEGGDFSLLAGSPALDSGFGGPATKPGVSPAAIAAALAADRDGSARLDLACVDNTGTGAMPFIDRGPLEAQPSLCGPPGPGAFTRGDVNGDRFVDLSDSLLVLFVLFQNTVVDCPDAADTNDDGVLGLTDVLGVLDFLFLNGAPPAPPFPAAGEDLTGDELGCDRQAA